MLLPFDLTCRKLGECVCPLTLEAIENEAPFEVLGLLGLLLMLYKFEGKHESRKNDTIIKGIISFDVPF